MKRRSLGRTGVRVSELCFGTLNFGWSTSEEQALAVLDAYRGAGGKFIQGSAGAPFPHRGPQDEQG